jgi:DNA-binding GntR family transcriptional regulator
MRPQAGTGMGSGHRAASERAYAHIKERLLDDRYPGGRLLSENEVAQELGVSRTPVRHALVQLEVERLVELYPKRGALVVPVSASEVEDVFEARIVVEEHCIRSAARAAADLVPQLTDAVAEQERSVRAQDSSGFAVADRRFHRTIVAAAGNSILTDLYDSLRDRQQRIAAVSIATDPARAERFLAEHRAIAAALEREDAEGAQQLVRAHLEDARTAARSGRRRSGQGR